MSTFFASPERAEGAELTAQIETVSNSPVMSGLLLSVGGMLAIVNEQRQIVALNDSLLHTLGIEESGQALGLRLGEALQCVHAHEEPAGCGTTKYCSTCGAAVAMVSGLGQEAPVEKICALTIGRSEKMTDMALLVRAHVIRIAQRRFLLVFLQDVTKHQQRAALERTFFHDVNNMLSMLVSASELLLEESPSGLARTVHEASLRLSREVAIQRCLAESEKGVYQPNLQEVTTERVFQDIRSFFANHPAARDKRVEIEGACPQRAFVTDVSLLLRVLCNMVINALEATETKGAVMLWLEQEAHLLSFCVWNAQAIPQDIASRIFQQHFSTKAQCGRGIGTFSMKFFGERILGGAVRFATSEEKGTVFRFSLPV